MRKVKRREGKRLPQGFTEEQWSRIGAQAVCFLSLSLYQHPYTLLLLEKHCVWGRSPKSEPLTSARHRLRPSDAGGGKPDSR